MTGQQHDPVDILNGLIETCRDGEEGFRHASEAVEDPTLARLMASYSQQRAEFGRELREEVVRLGRVPAESGHLTAAVHRGWMDLRAAVASDDEAAIVAECERDEDAADRTFRQAMEGALPEVTRRLVERQFLQVKEAHDHIRSLERSWAGTD